MLKKNVKTNMELEILEQTKIIPYILMKYIDSESGEIKINLPDNITKIILGQGWNSGKLTIYHSFRKTETLYITEGMFKLGELEDYIKENGYNLDNAGLVLIGISSLIAVYLLGYKYISKNKAER